jgi:hypothetical protein
LSAGERALSIRSKRAVIDLILLDFELAGHSCKIFARAFFRHHCLLAKLAAQVDEGDRRVTRFRLSCCPYIGLPLSRRAFQGSTAAAC